MDLEKIFKNEYNAYSEIKHLIGGKIVKESMPCINKEKFIEVVEKLLIHDVSQQRELLIAYEKNHYTPQEWALASKQCIKDIDNFLASNCG